MNTDQRNTLGVSMLVAGLVLTLVAASISWSAVQTWLAVSETGEASDQLRRGRVADARRLATKAASRAPEAAAPALLALDPTDNDAIDRLVPLALRADRHADRQAVLATVGLARMALGKSADVELPGTADLRLIGAMAAARAGRDPGKLKAAENEEPPHLSVLRAAHIMLMRSAWEAGRVSETRMHAGALLLLRPKAPEAALLYAVVGVSSPVLGDAEAMQLLEGIREGKDDAIRAIAALLPQRRAAIAAKWPKAVEGMEIPASVAPEPKPSGAKP